MITTIVFDLGNVLIGWNPRNLFSKYFDNADDMEYFIQNVCTMEWNEEQDRGRSIADATQILLDQYPDHEVPIRMYYDRWTEMISGPIHGTVEILNQLHSKGDYRLLALTNWSAELFPWARANFEFLDLFEGILVSGEEKMKKPEAAIYQRFCEKFDTSPDHLLFIDDSLKNVRGAKDEGWKAVQFESADKLKEDLKVMGVMV